MVILDGELVKGTRVRGGELYLLSLRSRDRRGSGSASRCSASRPRSQTQLKPGVLLGGEASYLRKYGGVDLNTPAGQAVAFGRNFFAVSKSLAIPRGGMERASGRHATEVPGTLDLTKFTRQQALLGVEYDF
jgi:hypothetical protein